MREFEVQSPLRWRMRLGRWHVRTWRRFVMKLPRGYRQPEVIYEVVRVADDDRIEHQFGAFDSESEALKCLALLNAEGGHGNLVINLVAVHSRLEHWSWDR